MANDEGDNRNDDDDLLFDLKKMINNPEASDVVLRCSDGVAVHGSRLLLANRCAYFKSRLAGGFSETGAAELTIPKFPSPLMISVVEFLYIGKIESNLPVDWQMGLELLCAGIFFMVPKIESTAQKFLRGYMANVNVHSQKAVLVEMLSAAVEFPELREENVGILQEIVSLIGPDWVGEEFSRKLSRIAVEYILSQRVRPKEEDNVQSVEEYYTFRKIVLWHVYQVMQLDDEAVRQTVLSALPGNDSLEPQQGALTIPADINQCESDVLTSAISCGGSSVSRFLGVLETSESKISLQQMLLHINFSQIPNQLLSKVIYPLGVVPSEQLLKAFVHQAIHGCTHYSLSQPHCSWTHSSCITASNDGRISQISSERRGSGASAFAIIPMFKSSDVCEWSVHILQCSQSNTWSGTWLELGFVCCSIDNIFNDEMLEKALWSNRSTRVLHLWARSTVFVRQNSTDSPDNFKDWKKFSANIGANSIVTFTLNKPEKTCHVRFGFCEAVWEEIADGDVFPAIGFVSNDIVDSDHDCTRVQLRVPNGCDHFITRKAEDSLHLKQSGQTEQEPLSKDSGARGMQETRKRGNTENGETQRRGAKQKRS